MQSHLVLGPSSCRSLLQPWEHGTRISQPFRDISSQDTTAFERVEVRFDSVGFYHATEPIISKRRPYLALVYTATMKLLNIVYQRV